jgi:hypothetical protein
MTIETVEEYLARGGKVTVLRSARRTAIDFNVLRKRPGMGRFRKPRPAKRGE